MLTRSTVKILLLLSLTTGCHVNRADDSFARGFIESLRSRDPAGGAQLEPGSDIAREGWAVVTEQAANLPPGEPDSVVLKEWATIRDSHGVARKLTYKISSGERHSTIDVWVVGQGRRYVNTVRTTAHFPR